jgi:hypothetical protein
MSKIKIEFSVDPHPSFGRVLNIKRNCYLTPHITGGYPVYRLYTPTGSKNVYAHVLAKMSFHGPRPLGSVIDHIDRDRSNSHLDNLRFVTLSENARNRGPRVKASQTILQYDFSGNLINIWPSVSAAASDLDMKEVPIWRCCNGSQLTYKWSYDTRDLEGGDLVRTSASLTADG